MNFNNINTASSVSSIYYNNYNILPLSLIQSMKEQVLELKKLEAVRSPANIQDWVNHLEQMLWHKPSTEKEAYRQARQKLLQLVGQAIESLAPTRTFNYPREFLDQMVLGLQMLKSLGFSEEAIQHLASIYKPWSEDILHYCEMGVHTTAQFSSFIALYPKESEKIAKAQDLIHAFETLQTLLAGQVQEQTLTEALLNFDRAWWEGLYLSYDPIEVNSKKELEIEIEKRMHQYVEQKFKALSMIANNEKVLNESVKACEFLNPILQTMELELDSNGNPITDNISPLLDSMSKSHFVQEIIKLFNDEKKEVIPQIESTKQEDEKPIINSQDAIVEQPKPPVETPISLTSIVDIEKVIQLIGPVIERTADYSHYQGRLADFINDHFEIIYKGTQVNDLSKVKEIYVTDIHFSMGYRTLYTALADLFTTSNSIIFAEAIKAMQTCDAKDAYHTCCMNNQAKVMGWDIDLNEMDLSMKPFAEKEKEYDSKQYTLLKRELTDDQRNTLLKDYLTMRLNILVPDTNGYLNTVNNVIEKVIPETFEQRTQNMIDSVTTKAPEADLSIIISGESHLIRNKGKYQNEPRFNLDKFMAFLKDRNAMIVKPKEEKLKEADAPYTAFLSRLTKALQDVSLDFLSNFAPVREFPAD